MVSNCDLTLPDGAVNIVVFCRAGLYAVIARAPDSHNHEDRRTFGSPCFDRYLGVVSIIVSVS